MQFYTYTYFNPLKTSDLHECGFEPFYVGKGTVKKPGSKRAPRHLAHLRECKSGRAPNSHKNNTIKSILDNGLEPLIIINQYFETNEEALDHEKYLIALWGRVDMNTGILTNKTDGGEGVCGISEELRQAISIRNTGYKFSEEALEKMRQPRGNTHTPESKATLARSKKEYWLVPGRKEAQALRMLGNSPSIEVRQKMRAGHENRSDEWREKQRAAQIGKKRDPALAPILKAKNPRCCPLEIMGVKYLSLNDARKATGLSRTQIRRHETYIALPPPEGSDEYKQSLLRPKPKVELSEDEKRRRANKHKRICHIELMGVEYFSIAEATRATGLPKYQVKIHPTYKKLN